MIYIKDIPLTDSNADLLVTLQKKVDDVADYVKRVEFAKAQFSSENKETKRPFSEVRKNLRLMCQGPTRCGYCEDSCADEVEHIRPKDWYPDYVFRWDNYIMACGPCNGPKNNQYAILNAKHEVSQFEKRTKGSAITPPPNGKAALINPREENPLDLIYLDIAQGTFDFIPFYSEMEDKAKYNRAKYTIDVLRLNARGMLEEARKNSFDTYRARLVEISQYQLKGELSDDLLIRLKGSLQKTPHQTVWLEMKRQRTRISALQAFMDPVWELVKDW